jgi:molybdopterin-guanine dinucleotide biosynthesis protein A
MKDLAGKPVIDHVLAAVSDLGQEIFITTNKPKDYQFLELPLFQDDQPVAGALEGLKTALRAASGKRTLVVACDMPFLQAELLEYLFEQSGQADVTIPRWNDRLQPLCAVYSHRCLPAIEASLAAGEKRMISFHDEVRRHVVEPETVAHFDPEGLNFFNLNTPQELAEAERIYARRATSSKE